MNLLVSGIIIITAGGFSSLIPLFRNSSKTLGVGGILLGNSLVFYSALSALLKPGQDSFILLNWPVPLGSFSIGLDPLSSVFILPITILTVLCAFYGSAYLKPKQNGHGIHWFLYSLLSTGMILVLVSKNSILFLVSWEIMTLSSFFLITRDHEERPVRKAGILFLVVSNLGAACLIPLFILTGRLTGGLEFPSAALAPDGRIGTLLFILALIGFGIKAGIMPLHIWLPEVYPAAPAHISALSGGMINLGLYGLIRVIGFFSYPEPSWAWIILSLGAVSGLTGIICALAQKDIMKLLAYSSIENMGILFLCLGIGLLGVSLEDPSLSVLGFTALFFHMINHSFFKGALFLGAGAVFHRTGQKDMELLGGLLKKMPRLGIPLLASCAAITALPPFNGFFGEFLLYYGAISGVGRLPLPYSAALSLLTALMALIGGLTLAAFTKFFAIPFLGQPRSLSASVAEEPDRRIRIPVLVLSSLCLILGLFSPIIVKILSGTISESLNIPVQSITETMLPVARALSGIILMSGSVILVLAILVILRKRLLSKREVSLKETWGCGYGAPSAKMQYTGAALTEPLETLFKPILKTETTAKIPEGLFPDRASVHRRIPDPVFRRLVPLFRFLGRGIARLTCIQHGRIQLYLLYIIITVIALLIWQL